MRYLEHREWRERGTSDFPFAFYHLLPNHPRYNMVDHWHTEYELIRVLSGRLRLILDGEEMELLAGDAAFVTDGVLHGGTPLDCRYECLVFDLGILTGQNLACNRQILSILNHQTRVQRYFPAGQADVQTHIRQIFESMRMRAPGYQLLVQGALYSFLGIVTQQGLLQKESASLLRDQRRLRCFKSVLSYIRANYHTAITLDDLAKCSGMNEKYFCRFFKEFTQKSPMEYVNYYRVECACEQMVTSGRSVTEIALACGFNDVSYFAKVFRRFKGVTPSQYVKTVYSDQK